MKQETTSRKVAKSIGITIQVPSKIGKALDKIALDRMTSRGAIVREILVAHLKLQGALQ